LRRLCSDAQSKQTDASNEKDLSFHGEEANKKYFYWKLEIGN
jgi:hypothetical protein